MKILELFHLEKYAKVMRDFGFPDQLRHRDSGGFVEEMLKEVDEDDQERFLALMNTLIIMSKDIKKTSLYQAKKPFIQPIPKYDNQYTTKNETSYNYTKNDNPIIAKNDGHYLSKIDRSRVRPPIASQFRQSISINNTTSSKKT